MPRSVYEHLLRLTGDSTGLVRAADGSTSAIKRLDESSRRGQASLDRYNSSLQVSTRATTALARAFGGITVGLVAREFIQAADSMTLLEGRLKLVTNSTTDLISTQKDLFSVAQDSRASLEATTSFYVRLAQRLGDTTTGTLELREVTELVSKSLKIGGATAKETSSSLLQLSQALSSGLLRGDEFRSLSENAVGLMQNIADGANVTQAELREMSIEGKLTTEFILEALANSAPEIRRQFNQIPVTFGDAVQRLQNIAVQGVADFNKEFDLTGKLVTGVELLSNNIDTLAATFTTLLAIKLGRSFQTLTENIAAARAQTALETAAIKNNERAVLAEVAAKLNKAKVEQAAIIRQKALVAEKIRETEISLAQARSDAARAVNLSRLAVLETQQIALKKQLTASTAALVAAETASASAKRGLAVSTGVLNTAMTALGRGVTLLGGPLGLILLATQAAFMFGVFGDGAKQVDLTEKSLDRLNESTRALTGLTYEQLTAEQESVQAKIKQIEADDLQTESSLQKLEVLKQLKVAIEDNILLTREGAEAAVEEAIASATALSQRVESAKAAAAANQGFFGTLSVSEQLLKAEKAAADKVLESYENYEKVLGRLNGQTTDISRDNLIKGFQEEASKVSGLRNELDSLVKLQKEVIDSDELNADGKKALADRITKLTKEINGSNTVSNNKLSVTEKLIKKERELKSDIEKLTNAHRDSGQEVSQFSVKLEKKRKELENHLGIVPDVKEEVEKLTAKYKSGELSIKEYEQALKQLKLSQAEVQVVMDESGATYDKVESALKQLTRSQQDQLDIQRIAATEGEVAAEVYEQLAKVAKEHGLSVDELKERYPDLVEAQARFIEQREGIEDINNAIEDFSQSLADAIVDGEDLGEFFKNLWKQMVKDFLASGITKLIGSLVGGNGLDFSGFVTGSSSGGSGLGGLLGSVLGVGGGSGGSGGIGSILSTANSASSLLGGGSASSLLGGLFGGGAAASAAAGLGSLATAGAATTALATGSTSAILATVPTSVLPASFATGGAAVAGGTAGGAAGGAVLGGQFAAVAAPVLAAAVSVALGRALTEGITGNTGRTLGTLGGPAGAAVAHILDGLGLIGNSREYAQILQEDYLPALLGINTGSAIGVDGATGFNGGNTGIFGANFGITGTGVTAQLLADGGENGNGGFLTGAQSSLDALEELFKAAGFDRIRNEAGVLQVLDADKNVEDIMRIWQAYADGLNEAVPASEVFRTAVENGLISIDGHARLFFENFALGFGQSAFEARDSLLLIDERFDELRANGTEDMDALFQSISEHYGIAIEESQLFVEQTGVSAQQWVDNFTAASDDALTEILDFNEDGVTAFESGLGSMSDVATGVVSEIGSGFTGLTGVLSTEAQEAVQAYNQQFGNLTDRGTGLVVELQDQFTSLTEIISSQGEAATERYLESILGLEGALGSVNLGSPQVGSTNITVSGSGNNQSLGQFNSALSGSETVNPGGLGIGTSQDQLYTIGVNTRESVTVNRKGMIERIEEKVDNLTNSGSGELVNEIRNLVAELRAQTQELEFTRSQIHGNFN